MARTLHPLGSGWRLEPASSDDPTPIAFPPQGIPASVPGCVHTDLLAANLIDDPFLDLNELDVRWIGERAWRYRCAFDAPPEAASADRLDLAFDGLDTVATIELNGREVARTRNMHRSYRFDVTDVLSRGVNELAVTFASALRSARDEAARLGERPRAYGPPFNFIRKAACNFGWDWGPTLVTAGIWREARLEAWSVARLARVRPLVRLGDGAGARGTVELRVELERGPSPAPLALDAVLLAPDGSVAASSRTRVPEDASAATLDLAVRTPEPWWPVGYGAQPLYRLEVTLADTGGRDLDRWNRRIGFRRAELDASEDAAGRAFTLRVGGRAVFARGVNWIPDDVFPSRVGPDRYLRRLRQARAAGVNLVRVWGGGIYESDAFYDACDELGILVWQDFAFACAAYPEEEPFPQEIEAEAADAVVRLLPHPSLILWNGNNENLWGHEDWGWKAALGGSSWGRTYYLETLPRLVHDLDPTRPYWPGSPWSGSEALHPNLDLHGCMHIWDAWNERDYTVYLEYRPRFVAEFGHQGPPAWATLTRAVTERPLRPDGAGMLHHQKAVGGNDKLVARMAEHFPVPDDIDAWLFAAQLNQARAVELGVRHFRSLAPHCMGSVVWQLNDCWPVTSWAAVDGDGRLKPLWHALRHVYRDRLMSLLPDGARGDGDLLGDGGAAPRPARLSLHNDSDEAWPARVRIRRVPLDAGPGTPALAEALLEILVPPRTATSRPLPPPLGLPADPCGELLVADEGEQRAVFAFARDKELRYAPAELDATVERDGPVQRLHLRAKRVVRDITLFPDRLDPSATVDDALVTLLPGESHTFTVLAGAPLALEALSNAPVLASANDLRAPAPSR